MSFGLGVGDFLATFQLANKLRERFVNAPEQFKAISNEVTNLSNILRDIETLLSQQVLTDWQKKALASLLEECHNVLIAIGKVIDESYCLKSSNIHGFRDKSRRVWTRLKLEPDDIQVLRARMALNVGFLCAFNGSLMRYLPPASMPRQIYYMEANCDSKVTLVTKDEVKRLHERQDSREHCEEDIAILDWFTSIDYASQQSTFIGQRQEGTGQLLLDSTEFQSWLHTRKETMFCPGIPGAGKTILASIVVNELITRFKADDDVGIAYVYCNFKRNHEQKLDDLLSSLLKQLAQQRQDIPDDVKSLYHQHKSQRTRPSTWEVSQVLHSVISSFFKVFIIIDALDECQINDGCRAQFISEMISCEVNLFATSRFIPEITEQFNNATSLKIRASGEDVGRYIDGHMLRLSKYVSKSFDLQEKIKNVIVETVDGMFLLAKLHLDSLTDKTTPRAVVRALETLPRGSDALDIAYGEAITRIKGQATGLKKLLHAIAVEPGDSELGEDNIQDIDELISLCAGLVIVDQENDVVRLVHYTAQEFFERHQDRWIPDAETELTAACVAYLSLEVFKQGLCHTDGDFEKRLRLNPFFEYAAKNWGHHARKAPRLGPTIIKAISDLFENKSMVDALSQGFLIMNPDLHIYYRRKDASQHLTGLHLAAFFGIEVIVKLLLTTETFNDEDLESSSDDMPLSWAAEYGHEAVVQLLLATEKYDINCSKRGFRGRTPLMMAALMGHDAIVKALLANDKVDVDSIYDRHRTPLLYAAFNGHEATAKLLLEAGAEVDIEDGYKITPMLWAANNGHEAIVKLLLELGADVDGCGQNDSTPLLWATQNGHTSVVKILLEAGADVNGCGRNNCTPLLWAAKNGHTSVMKLLLNADAEIDAKKIDNYIPLLKAKTGREDIIKLLLEAGAEILAKDLS